MSEVVAAGLATGRAVGTGWLLETVGVMGDAFMAGLMVAAGVMVVVKAFDVARGDVSCTDGAAIGAGTLDVA